MKRIVVAPTLRRACLEADRWERAAGLPPRSVERYSAMNGGRALRGLDDADIRLCGWLPREIMQQAQFLRSAGFAAVMWIV